MFGLMRVTVIGPSMEPTLKSGEEWLVTPGRVRPGCLVLVTDPQRPALRTIKRVVRADAGGWWIEGDNREHSRDSRHFGPVPRSAIKGVLRRRLR